MKQFLSDERGQVLVYVTLAVMTLIAFIGLAVDTGNIYAERRRMQNAADAGALAGARELCLNNGASAAEAKAAEYMQLNGVAAADIGSDDITVDGHIVNVRASETADTYIAGLAGFPTMDVHATSAAACGAATGICGLWPVGFSTDIWEDVYDNGNGCGSEIVVWSDSNNGGEAICEIDGVPQTNACNCYDCDLDDDGDDDFIVAVSEGRAWLDYTSAILPYTDTCSSPGCGASELACYLRYDYGARVDLPACVSGDSGVKAGVKDDVDTRIGDAVLVPLFDSTGCGSNSQCGSGESYHVVAIGCVTIVGWEQNFSLDSLDPSDTEKLKGKVVLGTLNCSGNCMSSCGSTDGTAPEPWQVTAVSIIE